MTIGHPITQEQRRLVNEFYATEPQKVLLDKNERKALWERFKANRDIEDFTAFEFTCPALFAEVEKAIRNNNNVQSAVFSECVYAQAIANQYELTEFATGASASDWLSRESEKSLAAIGMHPRYMYRNSSHQRLLVQAGGHAGVDSALISILDDEIITLEFKEPGSKASEPDLPPYGPDGLITISAEFLQANPQFASMVREKVSEGLNFFDHIGNNINDFSSASIERAVTENYAARKKAAAICTEDTSGLLTLVPVGQVHRWARLEGEIRPAGRNDYPVWTPERLQKSIELIGGNVRDGMVQVPIVALVEGKQRGGSAISRLKIDSLFFVRTKDAEITSGIANFALNNVRQLRPTITAKMFFEGLEYEAVKQEYLGGV